MKTKQRTLAVLLVLVLVLGGLLWFVSRSNAAEEAASSAAAEGSILLSSFAAGDVTSIRYAYGGETLTLNYDSGSWTLADDPDYHLDASACNTMVTALASLNAKRQLTAQPGEDYGLADPAVTVTVTAAGETNTFAFGTENPVTGDLYVQKAGDDAVYTVSGNKAACFELTKADLFGAFNPAGLTASALESVSITTGSGTLALNAVSEPAEAESDSSESAADSTTYQTVWRLADEPSGRQQGAEHPLCSGRLCDRTNHGCRPFGLWLCCTACNGAGRLCRWDRDPPLRRKCRRLLDDGGGGQFRLCG